MQKEKPALIVAISRREFSSWENVSDESGYDSRKMQAQ
jgi:hypothetical protein